MNKSSNIHFDLIKAILFDVDGVLTDGKITYDAQGQEIKSFNVKDGQLIQFIQQQGIVLGAISGRNSTALQHRLEDLNIDFKRLGVKNKIESLHEFMKQYSIEAQFICYIGDDIIDIGVLTLCGIAVAPADASKYIFPFVDIVTTAKGGEGVLREIIDKMIDAKGLLPKLLEIR